MKSQIFKIFPVILFFLLITVRCYSQVVPSSISGLITWLPSDSVLVDGLNHVNTWKDISGNNNHAIQSNVSLQPILTSNDNTLNNKPLVRLDGIDDFLEIMDNSSLDFTDGFSFFIVAKQTSSIATKALLCKWDYGVQSSWALETGASNGFTNYVANSLTDGGGNQVQTTAGLNSLDNYFIVSYNYDGTQGNSDRVEIYHNGMELSSSILGTINPVLINSAANIRIGSFANLGRYFNGDYAEIIIFNRTLNSTERVEIETYLKNKYAQPVQLPSDIVLNSFCDTIIYPTGYFTNYTWSNGSTSANLTVNTSGKYWVDATNIFGVVSSDTINVNFPTINTITNNSIFCQNTPLIWNTNLPHNLFSFAWSDTSIDSVLVINQGDDYHVRITDTSGCFIDSDTITVTQDSFPTIASLGPDTSLCAGNRITLMSGNTPGITYVWGDSSINDSLVVNTSGVYTLVVTNTNNCVAEDTINVTIVGQAPIVGFENILACKNSIVSFNDTSIALSGSNITQWFWDFGDPTVTSDTADIATPNYTYTNTGFFTINLTVITNVGCSQNLTKNIFVYSSPTVELGPDTTLCGGNYITPTSISGTGLSYFWNDNSINDSLLISSSGMYMLVITNSDNCTAKDSVNVFVPGNVPTANFSNSITCNNSIVIFTDNSVPPNGNTIANWSWDFGNISAVNDTSILQNSSYVYTDTGAYTINLTVTTNAGCKQNISKNIYIYPKPIVDFTNVIACQNDTAFFNDAINPLGYPIINYQWNFGDASSGASNTSANSDPFHIFSQTTNYQVQLIATNSQVCKDSISKSITVRDEVSANFNFTSACVNVPISFTDNSIAPLPNNSNTRNWSFFPGSATGLTTTKTYSTAGPRNVMLKVTGFNGCISTITKQIQVSLPPDADFNSSIICVGDSFQLTDVSLPINGTINSWQWKDANTVFSNTQNPKYILNTVGNKNIFLQVTNDEGCIDTITKSVFANPLPDASFDIGPSIYLFTDSPITFTPALTSATNYFWTFSDGNSYSDQNLSLPFTNEGSYNVNLAITNNLGCRNNSLQPYTVARRNTDLGIIAARSTIDNDGFVGVEADLFNYGSSPITTFEILYELTGGGIMKETWVVDTLPPAAVLLFKFSAKSFLNVNERKNAISCIKILTVNNVIDDNISNNENCAALNSDKQLVAEPFPNPADGDVTLPIVLTEDKTINITIYDYLGKLIAENLAYEGVTGLNFIKIPSATYSSGTYTLKISISDNNYIRKLIKQGANK